MKLKKMFLLSILSFVFIQMVCGQVHQKFLFTKGNDNISTITMGPDQSPHCTVFEYPEFLVLHEIPAIPIYKNEQDSLKIDGDKVNPLITFIDSIYAHKPIKYILNSHYHPHSLSTVMPFLEKGVKLITAKENIKIYNKRGYFGTETSEDYAQSIILISSDTVLLEDTENPIEVLYLKKADYKSIPTETFLFFNFPKQKLLATSCMVYLRELNEKYGFKGIVYNDRLVDVNKIIADKNIEVENTLQLYKFRIENDRRMPPVFSFSFLQNVLKQSWHRLKLSEHLQAMSFEEMTTKKDSLLNYLGENDIYEIVVNHAVYALIEKQEYQKAVALAQILIIYEPGNLNEIDTLGEAYYNNGQIAMAQHYNSILLKSKSKTEGLGLVEWEKNRENRLQRGT